MEALQAHWLSFAVALGAGLLIGVERERRKGRGQRRAFAGVRTFTIATLAGALAQWLGQPLVVAAGALMLLLLITVGYLRERSPDRGITTEIALFVAYLLGVASIDQPLLAGAGGVVVAGLLAARTDLHRFSTEILTEGELRDALILAGAVLVVLPLIPNQPVPWLAGVNPRRIWMLVVIMLALQAAGHVALRLAGARLGLTLSGLAMGFVSSTATHAAMGAKAREHPSLARAAVSGALASNVATLIQLGVIVAAVDPRSLSSISPMLAGGGIAAILAAALRFRQVRVPADAGAIETRALRVLPALAFASLMSVLIAVVTLVHAHWGEGAALVATVLAAFADLHASAASLAALAGGDRISTTRFTLALALAFLLNTGSKWAAAHAGGGWPFARAVLPGLLLTVAGVAAPLTWSLAMR